MTPDTPPPALAYGPARTLQLEADGRDDALTIRARARNPRVKHWWGRRTWNQLVPAGDLVQDGDTNVLHAVFAVRTGAWCYLCRQPIATWSSRAPITEQARAQVHLHRAEHIRDDLGSVAIPHEGRP